MLENQTQIMRGCTKSFFRPQNYMTKRFHQNQTSRETEFQYPKSLQKLKIETSTLTYH